MTAMSSDEIRRTFLEYYESQGHLILPSFSLIPPSADTSALFTVAGMHPMKAYFAGTETPAARAGHDLSEGVPDRRHRHHRHHHPAPVVLRDARQLLVR